MGKFKVWVNPTEAIEIDETEANSLDSLVLSGSSYHVLYHSKSYNVDFKSKDVNKKTYQLIINNRDYEVTIQDQLDQLINSMGFQQGTSQHVNQVKAPMPGLILDIMVNLGDAVTKDQPLLILEAMKMENSIASPTTGTIKSIEINKGDSVTKNQLLIEFD